MRVRVAQDGALGKAPGRMARRWRDDLDRLHTTLAAAVLSGTAIVLLAWPGLAKTSASWDGTALLIGGALIGLPHGSSDFVVAHRALKPVFGRSWLPTFVVGYLAVAALVMLGWLVAPRATLLGFVLLSGLHLGRGDMPARSHDALALLVRATTPLLPVLLLPNAGVTDLVALLGGMSESTAARVIDGLRWPLLLPWAVAVLCFTVPRLLQVRGPSDARRSREALEIAAIAFAAVTLQPLLAFALYFCLVHAVRHMIVIADDAEPYDPRRAIRLVAAIVIPSALGCLVVLALSWNGMAGSHTTLDVLAWSIRLIAALTVPHMALEAWAERMACPGPIPV